MHERYQKLYTYRLSKAVIMQCLKRKFPWGRHQHAGLGHRLEFELKHITKNQNRVKIVILSVFEFD